MSTMIVRSWRCLRWVMAAPGLLFALWACTSHPLQAPDPRPEEETHQSYEVNPVRDIDILFLIDDSPSMEDKQVNLRKNFPAFMTELQKIPGGLPNVHIAVVTSDLGAGPTTLNAQCYVGGKRGIFRTNPLCKLNNPMTERFIVSADAGMKNNFQGRIEDVFSCLAAAGATGCGFEHQLQAIRLALYENLTAENKGFLRTEAYLGIILLTDEDDCSAPPDTTLFTDDQLYPGTTASFRCAEVGHLCGGAFPPVGMFQAPLASCHPAPGGKLIGVQEIVNSVRALKPRPDQQIIVAAITGVSDNDATAPYRYGYAMGNAKELDYLPICSGRNGEARAALRIKEFVESFGQNGSLHSICADDFSPAMQQIGERLAAKLATPCITAPIVDTRPDPGVQADCQVIDRIPRDKGFEDVLLPACGGGNPVPCWRLTPDSSCAESGFKMTVDRGGQLAPLGAQQAITCLTCARPDDPRCRH
jgi:hypothetical protein